MEKENLSEQLKDVSEQLIEQQKKIGYIESEKLRLSNSLKEVTRELDEISNELKIIEQKILKKVERR